MKNLKNLSAILKSTNCSFDIHGFYKFGLYNVPIGLSEDLNLPYRQFICDSSNHVDLKIDYGKFSFQGLDKKYNVDHQFYLDRGTIFYEEEIDGIHYFAHINGLESETVKIKYYQNQKPLTPQYRLAPLQTLNRQVVQPILEYQLARKNKFFVHGAGIKFSGKTILLLGRGGSFKTTICYKLAKKGYKVFGDDLILFDQNYLYPTPIHFQYFNYYLDNNLHSEKSLGLYHKIKLGLKLMSSKNEDTHMPLPSSPDFVVFLQTINGLEKSEFSTINKEETLYKNNINCQMEWESSLPAKKRLGQFMEAYKMIFPDCEYRDHWKNHQNIFSKLIDKSDYYHLKIGSEWDDGILENIKKLAE